VDRSDLDDNLVEGSACSRSVPVLVDRRDLDDNLVDGSACSASVLRLPSFLCFLPRLIDRGPRLVDSSPDFRLGRRLRLEERWGSSFLLSFSISELLNEAVVELDKALPTR
jgi:hypothetical protein